MFIQCGVMSRFVPLHVYVADIRLMLQLLKTCFWLGFSREVRRHGFLFAVSAHECISHMYKDKAKTTLRAGHSGKWRAGCHQIEGMYQKMIVLTRNMISFGTPTLAICPICYTNMETKIIQYIGKMYYPPLCGTPK